MARKQRGGQKRADAKQRVKTARRRSNSSTRWLQRQLNDPYVQEAKRVGYRSRAAFKLIDIDDKYRLIRRRMRVVDLGAAPGGWCQVAAERIGPEGRIVAVDLLEFGGLRGVDALVGDFHEAETQEAVRARLEARIKAGNADAVSQFASFHLQMLDEPDYETAYIWFSISAALGLKGTLEARDDARDNVEDERLVDLQSEAGTIYESLNISLD